MIFDLLGRCAESDTDFEKEKVRNRRYDNRKIFKLLSVGIVLVTVLSVRMKRFLILQLRILFRRLQWKIMQILLLIRSHQFPI